MTTAAIEPTKASAENFDQINRDAMHSPENAVAVAGTRVWFYATSEQSAGGIVRNFREQGDYLELGVARPAQMRSIRLPKPVPTQRINGEPYRFAIVEDAGREG